MRAYAAACGAIVGSRDMGSAQAGATTPHAGPSEDGLVAVDDEADLAWWYLQTYQAWVRGSGGGRRAKGG